MARGAALVRDKLGGAAGEPVAYARPADGLSAVVAEFWFGNPDAPGTAVGPVKLDATDIDGFCRAADLAFGSGGAVAPKKGDRVTRAVDGVAVTYEVRPRSTAEAEWRFQDPQRTLYRLQLRKV